MEETTLSVVQDGLSAGALARRLGVATTTLRSWHQRYGLGPSGHQAGRHRRYTGDDVAALTVMVRLTARGVPAAEAAGMARRRTTAAPAECPAGDPAARGLARAARRLDALSVRATLAAAVTAHGVVHAWHVLAAPAFGHLSRGRMAESHRVLSRRVLGRCLSEVFAAVPRPPAGAGPPVLLVAADHRRDEVALDALAAALAERGIESVCLGAGLPHAALVETVIRIRPAVVVVWSHAADAGANGLLAAFTGVPGRQPVVVTVGQGWPRPEARRTLADAVAVVTGVGASAEYGAS